MDRLQLHLRTLSAVALLLAVASGCGADQVEIPDSLRGEPACAWIIDSRGHFADGGTHILLDEMGRTGVACLCLTEEEFETGARHDELNDKALEVCNWLASQQDFAWDECQMDHDSERWLDFVFWSAGQTQRPEGDALGCVGE